MDDTRPKFSHEMSAANREDAIRVADALTSMKPGRWCRPVMDLDGRWNVQVYDVPPEVSDVR